MSSFLRGSISRPGASGLELGSAGIAVGKMPNTPMHAKKAVRSIKIRRWQIIPDEWNSLEKALHPRECDLIGRGLGMWVLRLDGYRIFRNGRGFLDKSSCGLKDGGFSVTVEGSLTGLSLSLTACGIALSSNK